MRRRRRIRVRRTGLALLALVILALLLELNLLLPGTWPGGTDGGFRRWIVHTPSSERLRPPEGDLPPLAPDAITVVLRGGGGGLEVGVDLPGAHATRPDARGHATLGGDRLLGAGFVVEDDEGAVRHGAADPQIARTWTVHLPDPLPGAPGEPHPLEIRVLAEENGRPLPDVEVTVRTPDDWRAARTDERGQVVVDGLEGRALVTVDVDGRGHAERWVHPRDPGTVELALRRSPRIDSKIVGADGMRATVTKLRVVSPDGRVLWEANPTLEEMPFDVGTDADLKDARLEIWTPDHAVVRLPLAGLPREIRLPRGRTFHIDAVGVDAQRLLGARVTAHYVPQDLDAAPSGALEPIEVEVASPDTVVVVPVGRPARLLVEAMGSAPTTLQVGADEEPGRRRVRLEVGRSIDLVVRDEGGAPVAGASVIALGAAGRSTVRRTGTTLPDGTVELRRLPPLPVEVYAKARGTAWAARVVDEKDVAEAEEAEVPLALTLEAGRTLRLVVESPLGLPLGGVRVHVEPTGPGPQDVVPPDARPWRTGREGTLVLDDLRDRDYRVRFSLPGYETAVIEEVRPGAGVHFVTLSPRKR